MPVPRRGGKVSDIDSCGLTFSELQELWLGPHPTTGSCFCSREELVAAWATGRAVVMRLWGSGARRPMGWWCFEAPRDLKYPGYFREKSFLWRHDILGPEEKLAVEAEWQRDFAATQGMSARERREHLEHHDVPDELVAQWEAEPPASSPQAAGSGAKKRPRRRRRGQGEEMTGDSNAAAGILK
jgi:hypothetical protein